ncbi:MAG TPA: maleylpyruvate isomerase family mycothiol-dependent enzyme [Acidimicrobiales bacterium]|nr:maleylpyruvate isomerase family mycothiol-dependent enzyme [Acidimicrobiales bacterium]
MTEESTALLGTCWASIRELGASLSPAEWDMATDCPGWSVRDNVSHLIAIERRLLGLPADPSLTEYPAYVQNDIGRFNEDAVALRRHRSGAEVLAEFNAVTAQREHALAAMSTEDFDKVGWSPVGEVPYRRFMTVRLFDCWAHEQDIRRAVVRPGHLEGPVVDAAMALHAGSLGFVVGKRAGAPDGSIVAFSVTGPTAAHYLVEVQGRRAGVVDRASATPTATLTCDTETFNALLCGRWSADDALGQRRLQLDGDIALATAVAGAMGYVF